MAIHYHRYIKQAREQAVKSRRAGYTATIVKISDTVAQGHDYIRKNPGYKVYVYRE